MWAGGRQAANLRSIRGQQDGVGDVPLAISSRGGMWVVLVLMVTHQFCLAPSDPDGVSMPTAKLYWLCQQH